MVKSLGFNGASWSRNVVFTRLLEHVCAERRTHSECILLQCVEQRSNTVDMPLLFCEKKNTKRTRERKIPGRRNPPSSCLVHQQDIRFHVESQYDGFALSCIQSLAQKRDRGCAIHTALLKPLRTSRLCCAWCFSRSQLVANCLGIRIALYSAGRTKRCSIRDSAMIGPVLLTTVISIRITFSGAHRQAVEPIRRGAL